MSKDLYFAAYEALLAEHEDEDWEPTSEQVDERMIDGIERATEAAEALHEMKRGDR